MPLLLASTRCNFAPEITRCRRCPVSLVLLALSLVWPRILGVCVQWRCLCVTGGDDDGVFYCGGGFGLDLVQVSLSRVRVNKGKRAN